MLCTTRLSSLTSQTSACWSARILNKNFPSLCWTLYGRTTKSPGGSAKNLWKEQKNSHLSHRLNNTIFARNKKHLRAHFPAILKFSKIQWHLIATVLWCYTRHSSRHLVDCKSNVLLFVCTTSVAFIFLGNCHNDMRFGWMTARNTNSELWICWCRV